MNPIQKLLHPVFDYLGDIEDTELHEATRDGDLDRMRSLLSESANVNLKNCMGQTALAQAAAGTFVILLVFFLNETFILFLSTNFN